MAKSRASSSADPAAQLLVLAISDLVVEVVEAKCSKLKPREQTTLERRIGRAVATFVEGMRLSPDQRRANEKLESLKSARAQVASAASRKRGRRKP